MRARALHHRLSTDLGLSLGLDDLAPWEALDIDGITWTTALRADVHTRDAGGTGLVSQLIDPITGDHFSQGTIASRAEYNPSGWSNGVPTVAFDGNLTQYIGRPSAASGKHFVIAVLKQLSTPTARQYLFDAQHSTLIINTAISGTFNIGYWNSSPFKDSGDQLVANEKTVIAWEFKSGVGGDIYQDAVQIATGLAYSNVAISGSNDTGLGGADGDDGSDRCHMELAEILVGKGDAGAGSDELSASQKTALNTYLSSRYGIEAFP